MTKNTKENKKHYKVNSRPILNLLIGLGFFTVVFLVTMMSLPKEDGYRNNAGRSDSLDNSSDSQSDKDIEILAVVKAIDFDNKNITLLDVDQQRTLELSFTGGTNITDKYGKIKSMSQMEIGSMVDATYQMDKMKLTELTISKKAWEYVGVNNFTIDYVAKAMKIATTNYKYGDHTFILNGLDAVPVTTITEQDELTVRGYEETIWSVTVTRGHGTVILEDYQSFLGAFITIGYEAVQKIEEGLEIAVREGNFNLTVENDQYSATKNITVYRNQITSVSLSDLGPAATQFGKIRFEIAPFGADLFINGDFVSYANPVELPYGKHVIEVSLGGYTTYEGILNVDSAGKTIKIDLPETTSEDTVTVTETDNSDTDNTDTVSGSTPSDNGDNSDPDSSEEETPSTDDVEENLLIYVQKPEGASVYINGKFKCIAPGSFQKIIGTHVITFIKEGYKTMSYTIEVSDDGLDSYLTFPDLVEE